MLGWEDQGGWVDKATSVSDTNMAQCQDQYYVYAPSFPASHRVIDLLPLPPFSVQACPLPALALFQLLFWIIECWFDLMGLVFVIALRLA